MKIKLTGRVESVTYGLKAHRVKLLVERMEGFKMPVPHEGRAQSGDMDCCILENSDGDEIQCDAVIVANDKGSEIVTALKLAVKTAETDEGPVAIPDTTLAEWARDNHGQSVDIVLRHGTADMFELADNVKDALGDGEITMSVQGSEPVTIKGNGKKGKGKGAA